MTLVNTAFPDPTTTPTQPKNWIRWTAVAFAAVGWFLSFDLVRISGGAAAINPLLESTCGSQAVAEGSLDCASVLSSRWGFVGRDEKTGRMGTPIAAYGMAYFAFVGLWYLLVGPPTRSRCGWHAVVVFVVGIGALISFFLMKAMAFELHRWCVWCVATHGANAGLIVLTGLAVPWRRPSHPVEPHPTGRLAMAGLCACFLFFVAHLAVTMMSLIGGSYAQLKDAYTRIASDPAYARWKYDQQPEVQLPLRDDEAFSGAADSKNTVVAFIDFQCGACRIAGETLAEVLEQHAGLLRVVYRHYPKDPACNPHETASGHPFACRAAQAAEAARAVGGSDAFTWMRRILHENQSELGSDRYAHWAREMGLDAAAFAQAMESPTVHARIREDIELGKSIGVTSVPAIYLNGRRVEHWRSVEIWEALLGLRVSERKTTVGP